MDELIADMPSLGEEVENARIFIKLRGVPLMRVRFRGTRGSLPVPGPETVKYGGNHHLHRGARRRRRSACS